MKITRLKYILQLKIFLLILFFIVTLLAPNSYAQENSTLRYDQHNEAGQQIFLDDYLKGLRRGLKKGFKSAEERNGFPVLEVIDSSADAATDTVQVKLRYLTDELDMSAIESIPVVMCANPGTVFIYRQGIIKEYKYLDLRDKVISAFTLTEEYCTQTLLENGLLVDESAVAKFEANLQHGGESASYQLGYQAGTLFGYLLIFFLVIGLIVFVINKSKPTYKE